MRIIWRTFCLRNVDGIFCVFDGSVVIAKKNSYGNAEIDEKAPITKQFNVTWNFHFSFPKNIRWKFVHAMK